MSFTAHKSFKLTKGLYLEERKGAAFYKARASVKGKTAFFNTETTDYARAERLTLSWFKRLLSEGSASGSGPKSMPDAARAFLRDIRKPVTKEYHTLKWNAISDFFRTFDVDAVTTPVLKDFMRWRRQRAERLKRPLSANTVHHDMVTIRRILRHAVEEGWLTRLPVFPRRETITANPRPWLDRHEWETLQRVGEGRIAEGRSVRIRNDRADLLDFCRLMVLCHTRVDELRNVRVRDVRVVREALSQPHLQIDETGTQRVVTQREYLSLRIQGKTGPRMSVAPAAAIDVFERVVSRSTRQPDDLLFGGTHHRDGFRELLIASGLRKDAAGNVRNLKALRSTGLMLTILANPRINLKLLAVSAGTSVTMLDQFYLKKLTVDMGVEELV